MSLIATTRLASDVADSVKRQFGDESGTQITDADIIRWVNDGQREINQTNKVLKAKAATVSVAGQADYTLPVEDAAVIETIHYYGMPLRALAYVEVEDYIHAYDNNSNNVANSQGRPSIWYSWAGQITFWPTPQSAGENITILYTKNPALITSLGETLGLPDKYFNTLVKYVLSQAYEMDEDWDASNYKSEQVTKSLDDLADSERSTAEMTYPTISAVVDY